jgi:hypothetical protein
MEIHGSDPMLCQARVTQTTRLSIAGVTTSSAIGALEAAAPQTSEH